MKSSYLRRYFRGQHAIPQVVHKVQLFGYGVLHPRKSHPNLLRTWDKVIHRRFNNYLKKNKSAECLEDFPLPEHQNIRKAVLCVLPKEFCVRRSGKDPMIQGLLY